MLYRIPAQTYFHQKDIILLVLRIGNEGMIHNNYEQ